MTLVIVFGVITWGIIFPWLAHRNYELRGQNSSLREKLEQAREQLYTVRQGAKAFRDALARVMESEVVKQAPLSGYSEALYDAKQLLLQKDWK